MVHRAVHGGTTGAKEGEESANLEPSNLLPCVHWYHFQSYVKISSALQLRNVSRYEKPLWRGGARGVFLSDRAGGGIARSSGKSASSQRERKNTRRI